MTISPPVNVSHGGNRPSATILACGIDSLDLAIDLSWESPDAFRRLAQSKRAAKAGADDEPVLFKLSGDTACMHLAMRPHGVDGYEWMLLGNELTLKLGNWLKPIQRPSAMVSIRSEALWTRGDDSMVQLVGQMLTQLGARVLSVKVSRLDPCADVLIPDFLWDARLSEHFVTRAKKTATHMVSQDPTGFAIGRGDLSARLYDKPREIREKSGKFWMTDIWELPEVPDWHSIIRVEFQARRAPLKQLGINTWDDAKGKLDRLWSYLTEKWLRLVDDPHLHHTQQHVLPWWERVQGAWRGTQSGNPLVRRSAMNADLRRLSAMAIGPLSSIVALCLSNDDRDPRTLMDHRSHLHAAVERAIRICRVSDDGFTRRVNRKRARYQRRPLETDMPEDVIDDGSLESDEI